MGEGGGWVVNIIKFNRFTATTLAAPPTPSPLPPSLPPRPQRQRRDALEDGSVCPTLTNSSLTPTRVLWPKMLFAVLQNQPQPGGDGCNQS